jgi:hypothetical protein
MGGGGGGVRIITEHTGNGFQCSIIISFCYYSVQSAFRALIILQGTVGAFSYSFFLYFSLPRQFNLHVQYLERVSQHPLPHSIFTKLKQKAETWSLCGCDDSRSQCCNFCNETFSCCIHRLAGFLFYKPLLINRHFSLSTLQYV